MSTWPSSTARFTAILICLRDLIALVRRPASSFVKATEEEKIEQEISKEL